MTQYDLRLGNLILFEPFKDAGYEVIRIQQLPLGDENRIEGIILTDEELLRFGFEFWGVKSCNEYESYDRWVLHNVIDGTSNFEVHIIHSNYGGVKQTEICFSIDNDERQFIHNTDFVHNLQNTYYLCTGHELQYTQAGGV